MQFMAGLIPVSKEIRIMEVKLYVGNLSRTTTEASREIDTLLLTTRPAASGLL